jgi:tRNA uridine 5-carbamoylmethylation protein Kti12
MFRCIQHEGRIYVEIEDYVYEVHYFSEWPYFQMVDEPTAIMVRDLINKQPEHTYQQLAAAVNDALESAAKIVDSPNAYACSRGELAEMIRKIKVNQ